MNATFQPVDLMAVVFVLAVAIGCINHLWIKLPPAIGMLSGRHWRAGSRSSND